MPNKNTFRFTFGGVNVKDAPDAISPEKYASALNLRATADMAIRSRPGYVPLFSTGSNPITDLRSYAATQTDDLPRFLARDTQNGIWLDTGVSVVTLRGTPGLGVSMIPFRPTESTQTWMYVAGVGDYQKISAPDSLNHCQVAKVGIAEPPWPGVLQLPSAGAQPKGFVPLAGDASDWTAGGNTATCSNADRNLDTAGVVLQDPAISTKYSVSVSPANNYNITQQLTIGSTYYILSDVIPAFAPGANVTIKSIYFYSHGTSGLCCIVPSISPIGTENPGDEALATLRRGAIVNISNGSLTSSVLVLGVIQGPNQAIAFECVLGAGFGPGSTITGQSCVVVDGTVAPMAGSACQAVAQTSAVESAGIATLTHTFTGTNPFNVLNSAGTLPQGDDYIHLSLLLTDPSLLIEMKILFNLDNNNFTQNVLYYTVRQGDLVSAADNVETQTSVILQAEQNALIDAFDIPGISSPQQSSAGINQWTEILFPISSLTRIGGNENTTLSQCNAMQILVNASDAVGFWFSAPWVGGGFGPDVGDDGADYRYRFKPRASGTGVVGNPSPVMRYGVRPRRQQVFVQPPPVPTDPQQDTWDVYRYGGTVTSYRFIGSVPSGPAITPFLDNYSDAAAQAGQELVTDDTEPWPSIDAPFQLTGLQASILAYGQFLVVSNLASGLNFPVSINSWLPGTLFQLNGQDTYTLRSRPVQLTSPPLGYQFEMEECIGAFNVTSFSLLSVREPQVANVPHPYVWGPDESGTSFSVGDQFRPGTVFFTKTFQPDAAPSKYNLEICPPSEPLLGGEVMGGLSYVASSHRWWALYPAFNTTARYNPVEKQIGKELAAPFGHCTDGGRIYFWSKDGIYGTTGGQAVSLTDDDLYPLFPHGGVQGKSITRNGVTFYAPDYSRIATFRLSYSSGILYATYQDSSGTPRILVANLVIPGKNPAWCSYKYADPITTYWGLDQQTASTQVSPGTLYPFVVGGDENGKVWKFQDNTMDNGVPITCVVATREWDGDDPSGNGMWNDPYLDVLAPTDPVYAVPVYLGASLDPGTAINPAPGRQFAFVSVGNSTLSRFLGLQISWGDTSPGSTVLYQYQYFGVPNAVTVWRTRFLSHGLKGYQSIYRIEAAYVSTAPVIHNIFTFDGIAPKQMTLPATGGQYQKLLLTPTVNKGQLYQYEFQSSAPFQLILADWIVWVGEWGRNGLAEPFRLISAESPSAVRT